MFWLSLNKHFIMQEIWMPIDGSDVFVSNTGRIKLPDGRVTSGVKRGKNLDYMCVGFFRFGTMKKFNIHTLVMESFVGKRPIGLVINHIDGNAANNNLSNLEYCTQSENVKHSFKIGKASQLGTKNSMAKYSEERVIKIRELYRIGLLQTNLNH